MNVADQDSRSCWMDEPAISAPPLAGDATCDVLVVGAGIAGLSTAYELAHLGRKVMVIDRGAIASGMTARTTAHLATEADDRYSRLIGALGEENARLYHSSQVAALNRIEAIVRDVGIECDFVRVDGWLVAADKDGRKELEEEYEAWQQLGIEGAEWAEAAPMPGMKSGRALRFAGQGRFHPTRYLAGLARAITSRGGRLHGGTAFVSDEEKDGGVVIETESGAKIRAGAAVFATNSPVNVKVAIHTKQIPYRTYAIAAPIAKGAAEDALVWETWRTRGSDEFYHYVRLQPGARGNLLIIGGEDHRSGDAVDMEARFGRLERWARKRWPGMGKVSHRWSGQVLESADSLPFSGKSPGSKNIYVHTGDSGMGITHGVAGALTIAPLIIGEKSRFADLFDPGRKPKALSSLKEFAGGLAGAAKNFSEYLGPGDVASAEDLKPGEGAVVREGLSKIAASRTKEGVLIRRSAVCTHVGCLVQWNPFERCWDCPCHGSQFAPDGAVMNGPAVKPLAEVD